MKSSLKDKILFFEIKRKDKESFVKAYDLYVDDIYRFVYFKVSDKELAEDITSAVFLKSWDHILSNNISEFKTLKALFYRVARNLVIDHYRKKSTSLEKSLDDDEESDIQDENFDLEKEVDIKLEHDRILNCMNALKDDYREILILRFVNQLSLDEIAKILGKSGGSVRITIHRALKALKELAEKNNNNNE